MTHVIYEPLEFMEKLAALVHPPRFNLVLRGICTVIEIEKAHNSHKTTETAYKILEPFHKDLADRILVATAVLENLSLMTADERIVNYKHVSTINARK